MMQGDRPWSIHTTREEAAAQEFMQLSGLGEAAAMALSLTSGLGGHRHHSIASLKSWLAAGQSHVDQLQVFLLSRYNAGNHPKYFPCAHPWSSSLSANKAVVEGSAPAYSACISQDSCSAISHFI